MRCHGSIGTVFARNAYACLLCLTLVCESKVNDERCTILLCLSNPAGWSAVADCVPPVQRALKAIAKGRLPQCAFSGGAGTSATRIVWLTEVAPGETDNSETVRTVRALEFRDTSGTIRRIKF